MKTFGEVLRDERTAKRISQRTLAGDSGTGQGRISDIENDTYLPGLDVASRLAKGLGVSLTTLIARWEGVSLTDVVDMATVADADRFRRVWGLWENMSPETRGKFIVAGRSLLGKEWNDESTEAAQDTHKRKRRASART